MRKAKLERNTNETQIELEINLDGTGKAEIQTGIGFFDHMLTLLAFHSEMDIKMICHGDLEVDSHHSVEDMGIALGGSGCFHVVNSFRLSAGCALKYSEGVR